MKYNHQIIKALTLFVFLLFSSFISRGNEISDKKSETEEKTE